MELRHSLILPLLASLLVGCPAEPASNNAATNNAATNNAATNNATSAQSNNTTTPNDDPGSTTITVELVPLEWGLFGDGSIEGVTAEVTAPQQGASATTTLEIGPGAYALRVVDGSSTVIDVSGTTADRLVPVSGEISTQPFFVPETMMVELELSPGEPWRAAGQVLDAGVDLPPDAVEPLTEAGVWFDEAFAEIVAAADPGAATVELMNEIRERGGPIATAKGVLFVAPAQDGEEPPQIRGTWNNFEADSASELHRITPGLWARFIDVPAGEQEYKIYYPSGDAWTTDLSNPQINWDGFDPGTIGSFNSVIAPAGSRTVWLPGVNSPQLQNARDVYVHLPATYDGSAKEYPVLYVHDGNESIVRSQFHIVADETAAANPATETVLVFVALPSQGVRIDEYTMATAGARGDEYVDFLADTLVPIIDQSFRTRTERTARGLNGASLGGLISFWGAMQHADVFGYTAGMSSTFFWGDMNVGDDYIIGEIAAVGCQDVVYYLDSGSPDDNYVVTQTMRDTLDGLGCEYDYVLEENGRHEWSFWRGRFDGVLVDFADLHGG